jgi:predicted permease
MSSLRAWGLRFAGLFGKERKDRELAEELESHLQMHIEDNLRAGMTPAEARRDALVKMGGIEQTKEKYRQRRSLPFIESLLQDLRFGFRVLRKSPGPTAVAVLTLALAIGANTAMFSVVNAVLFEPMPYKSPNELVWFSSTAVSQGIPTMGSSAPDFREWRDRNVAFTGMAASSYKDFNFSKPGQAPLRLLGVTVTSNMFSLLGVQPFLGRDFAADEEQWGRHQVVLLSYGTWQTAFGGDQSVIGHSMRLDGENYTIIGVMPQGMPFLDELRPLDLWTPLAYAPGDVMNTRGNHYLEVIARLKPGIHLEQAQGDASRIAKQLEQEFPQNRGIGAKVIPLREQFVEDVRPALIILFGTVVFVLLIACVNVANLMLARASAREPEFAIRSALGASRSRFVRQLVLEGTPLAVLGAVCGTFLAVLGLRLFEPFIPANLPHFNPIAVNGRVLVFTTAICFLTAILFGLAPAVRVFDPNIEESLREAGRSRSENGDKLHMRSVLVISEVAVAVVLLVGAGLLMRTFVSLRRVDPGFAHERVLTMRIPLSPTDFPKGREQQAVQFFVDIVARVSTLPGVDKASVTDTLPMSGLGTRGKYVDIQGRPPAGSLDQVPVVQFQLNGPGYMETLGMHLKGGRLFNEQDDQNATPVAIINEAFVRRFFPDEYPLGKSIRMEPPLNLLPPDVRALAQLDPVRQIIGIVADTKGTSLSESPIPIVYAPYLQHWEGWNLAMMLVVRTKGEPLALTGAIRDQVHLLRQDQPVAEVATMDQLLARSLSQARFTTLVFNIFGLLALALCAVGVYSVMAYAVTQRTRDIGIRRALGAKRSAILGPIMLEGSKLALIGLGIGIAGALALTRYLSSLLYDTQPTDLETFVAVSLVLLGAVLLACYIPARRAMKVDPMVALRCE